MKENGVEFDVEFEEASEMGKSEDEKGGRKKGSEEKWGNLL